MHKRYLSNVGRDELITILNTISDAIFIDDALGNTLWINQACEDLYRIRAVDIIGKHVAELEKEGIFSPSVARLVMEEGRRVNIMHQNKEGKRILSTGIPIFDEDDQHMRLIISTSRDISELVSLKNQLDHAQSALAELHPENIDASLRSDYGGLIYESSAMYNLLQLAARLSSLGSTTLITGESGSGKGIIAKFMHMNGKRKNFPFVKINCGAIPDTLLESELFGYESGAFTGSRKEGKPGLFEVANGGTLFLDEISELPLTLQVKLLQAIQDREIQRVGGIRPVPVDVRIISATNRDLGRFVREGKFREDLFYRLNVVPIHVPPLRERPEDITSLARHFIEQNNVKFAENKELSSDALAIFLKYNWPGNVRELENIIERLVITVKENVIHPSHLPSYLREHSSPSSSDAASSETPTTLTHALDREERRILQKAAAEYRTTRKIAAALGTSQPTIVRKLKKHGISALPE